MHQRHIQIEAEAVPAPCASFEVSTRQMCALPAYFRIADVLRITALSRPTLYRRIAARRFPPPVRLGGRACGWRAAALEVWIADPEGYRTPPDPEREVRRGPGRPRKYLLD
jgi:prophage regulatory protein